MTSASFIAAGVAAQYLGLHPTASPAQVKAALQSWGTQHALVGGSSAAPARVLYTNFTAPPLEAQPQQLVPLPADGSSSSSAGEGSSSNSSGGSSSASDAAAATSSGGGGGGARVAVVVPVAIGEAAGRRGAERAAAALF